MAKRSTIVDMPRARTHQNVYTCNLAKLLLFSLNEGRDELLGTTVVDGISALSPGCLRYEEVTARLQTVLKKSFTQSSDMIECVGFATVVDSLSAIKYAKVTPHRSIEGITTAFTHKHGYIHYSTHSSEILELETWLRSSIELAIRSTAQTTAKRVVFVSGSYNEVHGRKTGATPNRRLAGESLAVVNDASATKET
jgi:formate C-acetyltransferase